MTTTPREAPISLRLGKVREDHFKAFRSAHSLTQSDALHQLIDAGLEKFGYGPKKPKAEAVPIAGAEKWRL